MDCIQVPGHDIAVRIGQLGGLVSGLQHLGVIFRQDLPVSRFVAELPVAHDILMGRDQVVDLLCIPGVIGRNAVGGPLPDQFRMPGPVFRKTVIIADARTGDDRQRVQPGRPDAAQHALGAADVIVTDIDTDVADAETAQQVEIELLEAVAAFAACDVAGEAEVSLRAVVGGVAHDGERNDDAPAVE